MTPWTVAFQSPQSMEFSRQEYQSRLPFSSLGDLPNPGIEPRSPALQADSIPSELPGKPFFFFLRYANKKRNPIFSDMQHLQASESEDLDEV